jgi:hypothetical protein
LGATVRELEAQRISPTGMRLIDCIAQGRSVQIHLDDGRLLPTADRFSSHIRECPLRYVFSGELVRCATQLAYAEGDRLSSCLDLVHIPSKSVWVEWPDDDRQRALRDIPTLEVQGFGGARRGGALITSDSGGRSGHLRSFWSSHDDMAYLSPLVTYFDFDAPPELPRPANLGVWRGEAFLHLSDEPAIDELLTHLRFCFDGEWATYYHERCHSSDARAAVLRSSLGCVAFDTPMLMAFFLLLNAKNLLPRQVVRNERLNRARKLAGKPPLLEHVEVSAPMDIPQSASSVSDSESMRGSPRLHHVRGHIARRGATVFWRRPHLRGNARLGQVRSRTVVLSMERPAAAPLSNDARS